MSYKRLKKFTVVSALLWCVVVLCLFLTEKSYAATFFISSSGSDTNSGISQTSPWRHAPGMQGCSGVCAAYVPLPGDRFILKGGDTWHAGAAPVSLPWTWTWNGLPGNPIYIGVDQTWFNGTVCGTSWCRPKLDGDNPIVTGGIVASCQYHPLRAGTGPGSDRAFVEVGNVSWNVFDNFEFRGLCTDVVADGQPEPNPCQGIHTACFGADSYMIVSYNDFSQGHNTFKNLYFHGWTHKAFNCTLVGQDGVGSCQYATAVVEPTQEFGIGELWDHDVWDGFDSDPASFGGIFGGAHEISNSVFRYMQQGIVTDNTHSFHDNIVEHITNSGDGVAHSNGVLLVSEWIPQSGAASNHNVIYNNVIRHMTVAVTVWVCPQAEDGADYYYNNIVYDVEQESWVFDVRCGGSASFLNNTFSTGGAGIGNGSSDWPGTLVNNLLINTPLGHTPTGGNTNSIVLSDQQATDRGITSTNDYRLMGLACNGLSPCPIHAGANLTSSCPNTPNSSLCSDSSDGGTLNVRARPSPNDPNGPNWDVGAFQFRVTPPPPTGLAAVVH